MSHSKHTLAVIHKDADTASSWVYGQLRSSDYFAKARQAAAARGVAGRLLYAVRNACARLTHRA